MSLLSALRVALATLLINKGRSLLTSLGIVIGVGAVIAMVAAAGGARVKLDQRLESAGKNLIIIRPGARTWMGVVDFAPLTNDDATAIRKQVGSSLVGVAPWQLSPQVASTPSSNCPTIVV